MSMKTFMLRHFRRRPIPVLASLLLGASLVSLGASSLSTNRPDPETACTNLATFTNFPVTPTVTGRPYDYLTGREEAAVG